MTVSASDKRRIKKAAAIASRFTEPDYNYEVPHHPYPRDPRTAAEAYAVAADLAEELGAKDTARELRTEVRRQLVWAWAIRTGLGDELYPIEYVAAPGVFDIGSREVRTFAIVFVAAAPWLDQREVRVRVDNHGRVHRLKATGRRER